MRSQRLSLQAARGSHLLPAGVHVHMLAMLSSSGAARRPPLAGRLLARSAVSSRHEALPSPGLLLPLSRSLCCRACHQLTCRPAVQKKLA